LRHLGLLLRHLSKLVQINSHIHSCKHVGLVARHSHHVLRRLLIIILSCHRSLLLHAIPHSCWSLHGPTIWHRLSTKAWESGHWVLLLRHASKLGLLLSLMVVLGRKCI
jgi:hypothetical protein